MKTDNYEIGSFIFESRETYDKAEKEVGIIQVLRDNVELSDPKKALKVYNRFVTEGTFQTIIGYSFLNELRNYLIQNEVSTPEALEVIRIKEPVVKAADTLPVRPSGESRYKRLYEEQKAFNAKYKIAVIALIIFLLGAVIITAKTKYSVFTYFTDYHTNMENELIDKYEKWEADLQQREDALKNSGK